MRNHNSSEYDGGIRRGYLLTIYRISAFIVVDSNGRRMDVISYNNTPAAQMSLLLLYASPRQSYGEK